MVTDATAALGFEPHLEFDGPIEAIDDAIAEHLVPVLREALSNVAKHAGAHSVQIGIYSDGVVVLTVADDGVGPTDSVTDGRGLANMADRAIELGGDFTITARPTGGSLLRWCVPA